MAFIGTPLDTRNTFQSLQGKRFSGDGSTTAFTLDVDGDSNVTGTARQGGTSIVTLASAAAVGDATALAIALG